jgi:hypothetical protein
LKVHEARKPKAAPKHARRQAAKKTIKAALAAGMAMALSSATPPAPQPHVYAAGQVWEYRTRPGEAGSLLKIQKVEELPSFTAEGPVYHISIIGLHLNGAGVAGGIQHLPVFRVTLDASVTRLSHNRADFPSADEGIAEWRRAQGGVFTIPVSKILDAMEQMLRNAPPPR